MGCSAEIGKRYEKAKCYFSLVAIEDNAKIDPLV
jgi:hypothetical protein